MNLGFDTNFLGNDFIVELPRLIGKAKQEALNNGEVFDFTHFSLVMNKKRKFATYTAHNIDQKRLQYIKRGRNRWWFDRRIGIENQVGSPVYSNNSWDRGHLVRRKAICWGSFQEAKQANNDSFCYANAAPQHENFNQDEWLELEDWILNHNQDATNKLSVLTGPIFTESDRDYRGYKIPAAYWKIIFYVGHKLLLESRGFIMKQDEFWHRKNGADFINLQSYQVTLSEISKLTGLEFESHIYKTNPLYYFSNETTVSRRISTPERKPIKGEKSIIYTRDFYKRN